MTKQCIIALTVCFLLSCESHNSTHSPSNEKLVNQRMCKLNRQSVETLASLGFANLPGELYDGQEMYLTGRPSNDLTKLIPSVAGNDWFIAFPICGNVSLDKLALPSVFLPRLVRKPRITKTDFGFILHPDDILPTDIYVALQDNHAIAFQVSRRKDF